MAAGTQSGNAEANTLTALKAAIAEMADNVFKAEAKTNVLSMPPALIKGFKNAKTGQIPSITMDGLGDYDKAKGYANGAVTLSWADYTLAYDRGRKFTLDEVDIMQEQGQLETGYVVSEFMRQKVIPEVDALNLSSIAQRIIGNQGTISSHAGHHIEYAYTPAAATFLTKLITQLNACQADSGKEDGYFIFVNSNYRGALEMSTEVTKNRDITAGVSRLDGRIDAINSNPVIYVPNDRMYAKYTTLDGYTDGETAGGFTPASSGGFQVAAQIVHKESAMAITAHNVTKIISAEANQSADGMAIMYRAYFDCLVPANKRDGCAALVVTAES